VTNPFCYKFNEPIFFHKQQLPANSINVIVLHNLYIAELMGMGFGIVQVHAHLYNVTLSHNETLVENFHRNGTNLGVVVSPTPFERLFYIFNHNAVPVWSMVAFVMYDKQGKNFFLFLADNKGFQMYILFSISSSGAWQL
jgi:hypothetical protein